MQKNRHKNGFTLIELIVVISIIGILVLLATPKFIEHTQEAKLAQIKNDVKVVETVLDEYLIKNKSLPETLQEFDYYTALAEDRVYGKNGLITNLEGTYVDVTDMDEVKAINSKLKGKFIANDKGEAYYVSDEKIISRGENNEDENSFDNDSYPKIVAIEDSSYILWDENTIYGFGSNWYGQLGVEPINSQLTKLPFVTEISNLQDKDIVKILGGSDHIFAISKNGDVYVMGSNEFNQLALDDEIFETSTPIKHEILSNFTSKDIKSGFAHSLLLENGKLYGWGYNEYGQLGLGESAENFYYMPTEIEFFSNNNINIKNVYAGYYNGFVITTDNKLYVWGHNYYGQLGLGHNNTPISTPVELNDFSGMTIKDIKTTHYSTFVLTEDGRLYSFGLNDYGQLGLGDYVDRNTPQLINVDGKAVDKIITGGYSIIAITTDGSIYGWGENAREELGFFGENISIPTRLTHIEALNPVDIQMGAAHTLIKSQNGDIYVAGRNEDGQLGLKDFEDRDIFTQLDLSFSPTYIPQEWLNNDYSKLSIIGSSSYIILGDNNVYAFGDNYYGQLGIGSRVTRVSLTPIDLLKDKDIIKIIGGYGRTFAISENGDVYSWGYNMNGELGLGYVNRQLLIPIKNEILSRFNSKDIKSGNNHNLLLENGKLYVWGYNGYGQLGLGDDENRDVPTEVRFFSDNNINIKNVYAGDYNSFVTTTDNKLYVWGDNWAGKLGIGNTTNQLIPIEVTFFRGKPIKDIKTNEESTFVLTEDGILYGFGYNRNGELGLGDYDNRSTPQIINVDNKPVDKIITGYESTIAITNDGAIYGWGWNIFIDSEYFNDEYISEPTRLPQIEALNPVDIKMGDYSIFLQLQNGDIYVLGANYDGELGLGHYNPVSTPTKLDLSVPSIYIPPEWLNANYPKIEAFGNSSFIIIGNNKVYSFGQNNKAQLGFSYYNSSANSTPTLIPTFQDKSQFNGPVVIKLLGGEAHTYAVVGEYVFSRFGVINGYGLNDGTCQIFTLNPSQDKIFSSFSSKDVKTIWRHNLLISDGKLYAWGDNQYGQLGLGDLIDRNPQPNSGCSTNKDTKGFPPEVTFFSDNNINLKNVYAGHYHSFATTTDNRLYVWGRNDYGQLGLGPNAENVYNTPTELGFFSGMPIKDIKTNEISTFVLTEDGNLYSFGYNGWGQLGLGDYDNRSTPQLVNVNNKPVNKIITGLESTIGITTDGEIYGWGRNYYSELGLVGNKIRPTRLTSIENLNPVDLKMGAYHTLIKTQSGEIYGVGRNNYGQLGLKYSSTKVSTPTKLDLSSIQ